MDDTLKGHPPSAIQFPVNQQLLEEATRLKEEHRLLRDRLEKIEAMRAEVSAAVYARVRGDYAARLEAAHGALLAKKEEVDRELATLRETRQKIAANLDTQKEALEEVRLRHSVGEFAEGEFTAEATKANEKLAKFEKLLSAVEANIQRYEAIFAGEPFPTGGAHPPSRGAPPAAAREVTGEAPLTGLLGEESAPGLAEEDYLVEEGAEDYFAAEPALSQPLEATPTAAVAGPHLTIVRGAGGGKHFPLTKETMIGRASNSAVALKEAKVSRQHAVIRKKGAHFVIEDLQSSNGLYVNGERVTEHRLEAGDEIQIGDFVLKVHL